MVYRIQWHCSNNIIDFSRLMLLVNKKKKIIKKLTDCELTEMYETGDQITLWLVVSQQLNVM